ncbi:MAG: hypothetical protein FWE72_05735 [Spirochaetaceae bacterium]|nr:hypothetical protein [Spirochaetaceae bacterium]
MKKIILVSILLFVITLASFAQSSGKKEEISISPVAEINLYTASNIGTGGGLAISYGDGISLGVKGLYFTDLDTLTTIEILTFVRFYILDFNGNSGLFAQIEGGPAFFFEKDDDMKGMISGGVTIGWRFVLSKHWYVEPVVRGGYPFIAGVGVSGGVKF